MKKFILLATIITASFAAYAQNYTRVVQNINQQVNSNAIDIHIYPVPTYGMITVEHGVAGEQSLITVLNFEGRIVQQVRPAVNTMKTQIDIGNQQMGKYVLRYENGSGFVQTKQIIKN